MMKSIIKQILVQNREFYQKHAVSFSQTRDLEWGGWGRVFSKISKEKKQYKILDVACGNCRLFKYIRKEYGNLMVDYLGLDQNQTLLDISKERYVNDRKFNISNIDVVENTYQLRNYINNYDVICVFGLTHHIPAEYLTKVWINDIISSNIHNQKYVIFSFWKIYKKYLSKYLIKDNNSSIFGLNDYFFSWKNDKKLYRYVHIYTNEEINQIVDIMKNKGYLLYDRFRKKESKKGMNEYLLFKSI